MSIKQKLVTVLENLLKIFFVRTEKKFLQQAEWIGGILSYAYNENINSFSIYLEPNTNISLTWSSFFRGGFFIVCTTTN